MKLSHALLGVLLLLPSAGRVAAAAAPAPAVVPAASPQGQQGEFANKFRQAMKIGAREEMEKLVRKYQTDAVFHVLGLCVQLAKQSNDQIEEEMDALRLAWKGAFASDFVEHMYNFFSGLQMSSTLRTAWIKLKVEYDAVNRKYTELMTEKEFGKQFPALAVKLEALAEAFGEVGDDYMEGTCWLQAAQAYDDILARDAADYVKALECLKKGLPRYEEIELTDLLYNNSRNRLLALTGAAAGASGDQPGVPGVPDDLASDLASKIPGIDLGPAVPVAMTYELVEDIEVIARPIYYGDEIHASWSQLPLRGVGSTARFPAMKEFQPVVVRTGSSKAGVELDGDGTTDVDIPIKGKLVPVEMEIGEGEMRRKWAILAATLGETESYQGTETNLAPTDGFMTIYFAPAASVVGEIGGTQVRVIDENMDGLYGSPPVLWHYLGLTERANQPEVDSIVVGGEKAARPWSEFQEIGGQWYRLEPKVGGMVIEAAPATLETGTLRLDYKGGKPEHVVVRGRGKLENAYFDLVQGGKKGVQVPAGEYELFSGLLAKGKRKQRMKALILAPEQPVSYEVRAGEVTEVRLGAPFGFDFDVQVDRDWVTVVGQSVCVIGSAGERYERPWNCVPRPEVEVREAGSKRGGKSVDMPILLDQETLFLEGFGVAWFPFDLTLENKKGGDVEVQLTEKKNKLFGSIESEWK